MQPYDVRSSFVQIVDADRAEAREVLSRIDPMRSLADRLSALGLDDRAVWAESAEELAYSLAGGSTPRATARGSTGGSRWTRTRWG